MIENVENNDWKKDAPVLAAMAKTNPFAVPTNYFESAEEITLSAFFLDGLKEKTPNTCFKVPEKYFEELTERIETNIKFSDPALMQHAFAVPENYFDTLQSRIADKIAAAEPKKVAKTVPMWRRDIFKYASAACFVLMASVGAYFYQNSSPTIPNVQATTADLATDQFLYDIDESTIIEHLEAQNTIASKTTSASDTEMENYILSNFSSSDLTQALNN